MRKPRSRFYIRRRCSQSRFAGRRSRDKGDSLKAGNSTVIGTLLQRPSRYFDSDEVVRRISYSRRKLIDRWLKRFPFHRKVQSQSAPGMQRGRRIFQGAGPRWLGEEKV